MSDPLDELGEEHADIVRENMQLIGQMQIAGYEIPITMHLKCALEELISLVVKGDPKKLREFHFKVDENLNYKLQAMVDGLHK